LEEVVGVKKVGWGGGEGGGGGGGGGGAIKRARVLIRKPL